MLREVPRRASKSVVVISETRGESGISEIRETASATGRQVTNQQTKRSMSLPLPLYLV